jgi:hypothetical protein
VPVTQRWADAVGIVAESALAAGLDPGSRGDPSPPAPRRRLGCLAARAELESLVAAID